MPRSIWPTLVDVSIDSRSEIKIHPALSQAIDDLDQIPEVTAKAVERDHD